MHHWIDIGGAEELCAAPLKRITAMNREFAVSYKDGQFGVVSNRCNHGRGTARQTQVLRTLNMRFPAE
jgi:nitrite reductase/ring-hydroxylating ferredoxin subunit